MKLIVLTLITFAPVIASVVGATLLALNGIAGWGWFLFIALLLAGSVSISE